MGGLALGSLFDGSGAFPLAGKICGFTPLWASEIEPFPIRVTTKRLPEMKHYGDISKLTGAGLPPVDIVTFGSPCQDLSVANGKRAGLSGERSGLFREAIRIIKEMRGATNGKKPRFICWENVPGAFSANGGADFNAVLDAIVQIAEPSAPVPPPDKNGWSYADVIVGDGWSIAYRLVDAQYFGVPQRRKRIYLVADFGSERAADILFEREGVSRDFTPRGNEGKEAAAGIGNGAEKASGNITCGASPSAIVYPDTAKTLAARYDSSPCIDRGRNVVAIESHPQDNRVKISESGVVQTLGANMGLGGGNVPLVMKVYGVCAANSNSMKSGNPDSGIYEMEKARTLDTTAGASGNGGTCVVEGREPVICMEGNGLRPSHRGNAVNEGISFTLNTVEQNIVAYALDRAAYNQGQNAQFGIGISEEQAQTVLAKGPGAVCYQDKTGALCASDCHGIQNQQAECDKYIVEPNYIVRRLTPLECCRLQGFPDYWCSALETPEPTEADIEFWSAVFEEYRRVSGNSSKPKTGRQIIKWLQNPRTDSAEYKMWGNGCALPCCVFALRGIAELEAEKCEN